jgi:hypothetical protein
MFNVLIEVQLTCVNGLTVFGQGKWAREGGAFVQGDQRKITKRSTVPIASLFLHIKHQDEEHKVLLPNNKQD